MGWTVAPALVRALTIATFLAVAAGYAASAYNPANPKLPLLAFVALGIGGLCVLVVLKVGAMLAHPRVREEAQFWTSHATYSRRSIPILMQLVIWFAVGGLFFAHASAWLNGQGWLSGVTAIVMLAVIAYPFVRHRIERGRWPD